MVNDPYLLSRARQEYPNHFLLVRIVSDRVNQLGKGEMKGQLVPRLIHRALQEAAVGQLALDQLPRKP